MLPRKQRHTAKRVHDRLRAETEYDGEYTTTPGYVRRWREANRRGSDGYGELVWAPGVAQIDFGVAKARIAGELVDDHCLVVTFPHSNMRYVTSLPGENAECLCHGLIEVFEHIGGVPPVIVMDNATGAGRRNARGEVTPAAVLDVFDIKKSLSHKGNPYDNAVVESTCGGPTTSGSTPPSDTGARRNSPNRDSSSKKPSNTLLPIHSCSTSPSAPARRISRSRWAGSRTCARYLSGSSPRPGCL